MAETREPQMHQQIMQQITQGGSPPDAFDFKAEATSDDPGSVHGDDVHITKVNDLNAPVYGNDLIIDGSRDGMIDDGDVGGIIIDFTPGPDDGSLRPMESLYDLG